MFEQLFGSKTRVKLIRLFLDNPEKTFYVRELTRLSDSLINSVRRELENLVLLKLVIVQESSKKTEGEKESKGVNAKKFYKLNTKNLYYQDLHHLFSKGKILVEKKFIERLKRLGEITFLSLGGFFVKDDKAKSDLLLIGIFEKDKVTKALDEFEKEIGRSIRYTVMDESEFQLRKDIMDRFLLDILNNENNVVVVNKYKRDKKNVSTQEN